MLVVMHDRDSQLVFQPFLDLKTFRCLDIFQVDTSEGRRDGFHHFDKFFRVFLVHFDIEHIDSREYFKEEPFPFHHRFTGHGADITQAQYRGTVGDYRY